MRMKNKLLRIAVTVCISSFVLSACEKKHGIVILPVNGEDQKHFEDKWAEIEPILKKHPDDIYYIRDFKKGQLIGAPLGSLPPILLVLSETDFQSLVGSDFTGHALQIGVGLSKAKTDVRYAGKEEQTTDEKSIPTPLPTPMPDTGESSPTVTPPILNSSHLHHLTKSYHLHLNKNIQESADLVEEVDKVLNPP